MAACTERPRWRGRQARALRPASPRVVAAAGLLRRLLLLVCAALPGASAAAPYDAAVAPLDVLLEVSADAPSPYVQALVRYRVSVLARVPLRDATLSEPVAEGALIERLGADRRFDTEREGGRYRVIDRLYAVVPQRAGVLIIRGPTLSAAVPVRALDPSADAEALMERRALVSRTAADLRLRVRPPPATADRPWLPAASVSISEHWQPEASQVRVGEPIERRVVIEASGVGARTIAVPEMPEIAGLRVYPQPTETTRREVGEDLLLTTTLRQTLVPTVPGILRMPALRLPWWNVALDEARQVSLPARDLVVAGPAAGGGDPADAGAAAGRERSLARTAAPASGGSWLVPTLAAAWLVTLALWWRERRLGGRRRQAADDGDSVDVEASAAEWLRRLRRACERNDVKAARDALAGWTRTQSVEAGERRIGTVLQQRGAGAAELALVRELDRCVYAPAGAGVPWDGKALLAAIAPLLADRPSAGETAATAELPPLFPAARDGAAVDGADAADLWPRARRRKPSGRRR